MIGVGGGLWGEVEWGGVVGLMGGEGGGRGVKGAGGALTDSNVRKFGPVFNGKPVRFPSVFFPKMREIASDPLYPLNTTESVLYFPCRVWSPPYGCNPCPHTYLEPLGAVPSFSPDCQPSFFPGARRPLRGNHGLRPVGSRESGPTFPPGGLTKPSVKSGRVVTTPLVGAPGPGDRNTFCDGGVYVFAL